MMVRHRRLRVSPWMRELVQEARLHPSDLILPLFVQEGRESTPVPSLPNVSRLSIPALIETAKQARDAGIPAIALFPVTPREKKTADGAEALNADNLVCRAIAEVKAKVPEIGVIADVALDPYTSHGHDGVLENGDVANDATVEILAKQAVVLARAGADVVAPSDMMDGRVAAIRTALEANHFMNTAILAYSAKYASALYGPFREAVGSATSGYLDKRTYQMNPANTDEAMREIAQDIAEGADMVMVKPAGLYMDVIYRASTEFDVPVFAYQVSGEYAMACAMPNAEAIILESLLGLKRAGARALLTYAALDIAAGIYTKTTQ
jgi:porphobilinogen synthase